MLPSCSHHKSYSTYKSDSDYNRPEFTKGKITLDNEMIKHLDHTKYEILHSHVGTKYKTRVNRFRRWTIKIKNIFDIVTTIINHVVLFVVLITKKNWYKTFLTIQCECYARRVPLEDQELYLLFRTTRVHTWFFMEFMLLDF